MPIKTNNYVKKTGDTMTGGLAGTTVSMSSMPRCRLYNSAAQTASSGSNLTLLWDTETYDVGSMHSTASNTSRITIPSDGYYFFHGHIAWVAGTADTWRLVRLYKNGATEICSYYGLPSVNTKSFSVSITQVVAAVAGDYFELMAYQDTGGNLNVFGGSSNSNFTCFKLV